MPREIIDSTFGLCTCGVSDGKCPPGTGCISESRIKAAREKAEQKRKERRDAASR